MRKEIENLLAGHLGAGMYVFGCADLRGLLAPVFDGYGYGISIARRLDDAIIDGIAGGPTMPYFDHYNRINTMLNGAVQALETLLRGAGKRALAVPATVDDPTISNRYLETLRMPFSHKMAATRAGLGWIGKTDLLVTKKFGPRARLASVLIAEPVMEPGAPIDSSLCGDCSVCVDACPAGAASGALWNVRTDRDVFFDAFACRRKCRELSKTGIDKDISLCGVCVSVCPEGRGVPCTP